jgi:hypothetical protein
MLSMREYDIKYRGAVEHDDGSSWLCKNGVFVWYNEAGAYHRDDGPAVIWKHGNGSLVWYLNGMKYTFDDWLIKANISDEDAMLLRLCYG